MPSFSAPFAAWQNFYVIVGSAAGALTGLQFIVIALIAQIRAAGNMREISAFGTPTVVHFCTALFLAALMVAPWPDPLALAVSLAFAGACGLAYSIRVVGHAIQAAYAPDLEDWLWYTAFPILAHLILILAAALFRWNVLWALSTVAADSLVFLLLGIHNSWDTVTYLAVRHSSSAAQPQTPSSE